MGDLDIEFREQLAYRIASYRRRRDGLALHREEIEVEFQDVQNRLRSAEELYEAEFGEPPQEHAKPSEASARTPRRPSGPLTGIPWGDALIRVLDEHGPLHVKGIWTLLQEGGFTTNAQDPLRSIVAIALREPSVIRVAPNTYALNGAADVEVREGGKA